MDDDVDYGGGCSWRSWNGQGEKAGIKDGRNGESWVVERRNAPAPGDAAAAAAITRAASLCFPTEWSISCRSFY